MKHIASKSADYNAAFNYLVFAHDGHTGKALKDEQGYPVLRDNYLIEGIGCIPETFALECRKTNKKYHKNTKEDELKSITISLALIRKIKNLALRLKRHKH